MYRKAIKKNSKYLFPFLEGIKYYDSLDIEHAIGTMMILNENGDILTCKHIAFEFVNSDVLAKKYKDILKDKKVLNKTELENKYQLNKDSAVLTNIHIPFNIGRDLKVEIKFHEYLDLAIIKFNGLKVNCDNYPKFSTSMVEQGQSLCKLGYAFPEYNYFEYSNKESKIVLKEKITSNFPLFPMDGIVTRLISDEKGVISMFETSTPGIRGQSGGPVFSPDGVVYGIQSMTKHLDLNFDIDGSVRRGVNDKHVSFTPFINLGVAISSVKIIEFLKENNIKFDVEGE